MKTISELGAASLIHVPMMERTLAANPNQPIMFGVATLVTKRMLYAKAPMERRVNPIKNPEFFVCRIRSPRARKRVTR